MSFEHAVEAVGKAVETVGIAATVVGIALALVRFGLGLGRRNGDGDGYTRCRQSIGRSILLGLELLVAGDIIRTVAISPNFRSVGVLALIVVIRTFLSFTLEVEIEGRWPWQRTNE